MVTLDYEPSPNSYYPQVKNGKNPFFLKRSKVKEIALEERFNELKQSGKLNSFLAKKRQKNSNKDHLRLPKQRRNTSEYK
jgi:ribosomal RNA-processing protein 36